MTHAFTPHAHAPTGLPPERLLDAHARMLRIRRFEEKVGQLYGMGLIGGYCHLAIGEEAVAVGTLMAANPDDPVMATHRCHGLALARGLSPAALLSEFMGRASGTSHGLSGSMHVFSRKHHFYGGQAIVGAGIALGTGLGFALRGNNQNGVALVYYGDGAADQGQAYESFLLAGKWRLPVLYICCNNVLNEDAERFPISARGRAFGIEGRVVDGLDFEAVYAATRAALDAVRAGGPPLLLEMRTMRFRGHSLADPGKYSAPEALDSEGEDPLARLQAQLLERELLDTAALQALERKIKAEILAASEFASHDEEPQPSLLSAFVPVMPQIRSRTGIRDAGAHDPTMRGEGP